MTTVTEEQRMQIDLDALGKKGGRARPSDEWLAEAKATFSYEPETGIIRIKKAYMRYSAGDSVGHALDRYHGGSYKGVRFLTHRLAWWLSYGEWPECDIDHINGNSFDNRLCNLRRASHAENLRNTRRYSSNKTGVKGVWYDTRRRKYETAITVNWKKIFIGKFDTLEEAAAARAEAVAKYHRDFARKEEHL